MRVHKINLSLIAFLNVSMVTLVVSFLFYFSFLDEEQINPKEEGFIRLFEKEAKFFKALGFKESGSENKKINKFGYLGKYQFGEVALSALGYYHKDGSARNDWRGKWTGKLGIFSKQDFINSPLAQEVAIHELTSYHWKVAKIHKLDRFIGEKMHGVHITREGILAAMHLKGPSGVTRFIYKGIDSTDALGTGVKEYMRLFSNYEHLVDL